MDRIIWKVNVFYCSFPTRHWSLGLSLSLSLSLFLARETPCHTVTSGRRRAMEGKGWDHCWLVRARSIASFVNGRGAQHPLCRGKFCGKTFLPLNGLFLYMHILHCTHDNILFMNVQISFQDYFSYRDSFEFKFTNLLIIKKMKNSFNKNICWNYIVKIMKENDRSFLFHLSIPSMFLNFISFRIFI